MYWHSEKRKREKEDSGLKTGSIGSLFAEIIAFYSKFLFRYNAFYFSNIILKDHRGCHGPQVFSPGEISHLWIWLRNLSLILNGNCTWPSQMLASIPVCRACHRHIFWVCFLHFSHPLKPSSFLRWFYHMLFLLKKVYRCFLLLLYPFQHKNILVF